MYYELLGISAIILSIGSSITLFIIGYAALLYAESRLQWVRFRRDIELSKIRVRRKNEEK